MHIKLAEVVFRPNVFIITIIDGISSLLVCKRNNFRNMIAEMKLMEKIGHLHPRSN